MSINSFADTDSYKSVLKEYYARYLVDVRHLSNSSVKHYLDALNNISKRLKEKNLVESDIYEIADLEQLTIVKSVLFADPDFIALDTRGRRMYSSGLNNYCRFAAGEGFNKIRQEMMILDAPIAPEAARIVEQKVWHRSGILRTQALELAGYVCEFNPEHYTFVAESTQKPYMEGHHAIPMYLQDEFKVSLDVYSNIICLCPICHRKIHFGMKDDRVEMASKIYNERSERLANSGIILSKNDFLDIVLRS